MAVVARQNTPLSKEHAAKLVRAKLRELGLPASAGPILTGYSWGIETGRGKSSQNHSLGNITATKDWRGDIWRPPWYSVDAGSSARNLELHEQMLKGQAPSAFRAYGSFDEGVEDYLRFLNQPHFRPIIDAASLNDPGRTIAAIKSTSYAPEADLIKHTATLLQLRDELQPLFPDAPVGSVEPPNPVRGLLGLAGILGGLGTVFFSLEKTLREVVEKGESDDRKNE